MFQQLFQKRKFQSMFQKRKFRSGSFYRKSLLTVLIMTSFPTAFIGIAMNVFCIQYIKKETIGNHRILLEKTTQRIDKAFNDVELALPQWLLNPALNDTLVSRSYYTSTRSYQDLNRLLLVMQNSFSLIDRIYLYMTNPSVIISNEEGFVKLTDPAQEKPYSDLLVGNRMFWKERLQKLNKNESPSAALVNALPFDGVNRYGVLITYINDKELNKLLNEMVRDEEDTAFILDESGHYVTSDDMSAKRNELRNALMKGVPSHIGKEDSFIFDWHQSQYSVSYTRLNRLGKTWTLVAATPLTKLTAPVALFSRITIMISLFGVTTALLFSWLASRRMYSPVHQLLTMLRGRKDEETNGDELNYIVSQWKGLMQESLELQDQLNKSVYTMREGFLMQFIQGYYYALTEAELADRFRNLGWEPEHKAYVLLFFQLHGFTRLEGKFNKGDEQLATFAAGNIAEEIVKAKWQDSELLNFQDLTFYVWIPLPLATPNTQWKEEAKETCELVISGIRDTLKLYVTVVIGRRIDALKQTAEMAEETRQAVRYRQFEEQDQILDMEHVLQDKSQFMPYPLSLENEIVHAFRMGEETEAEMLMEKFIHELGEKSCIELYVKQGLLKLFGSVHQAIVQSGIQSAALLDITTLYGELLQLRDQVEIIEWFKQKVVTPYMKEFNGMQDAQMRLIVERVIRTIEQYYMEDISLESFADSHGVFASSLSLAFKKKIGMNFVDYLTQYRIEKAKEMLLSTDLMISEVADHVGYQPSYFNRLFKKIVGITPGQYRNNALSKRI